MLAVNMMWSSLNLLEKAIFLPPFSRCQAKYGVIASVERTRLPLKETLTQHIFRWYKKLHLNRCHLRYNFFWKPLPNLMILETDQL